MDPPVLKWVKYTLRMDFLMCRSNDMIALYFMLLLFMPLFQVFPTMQTETQFLNPLRLLCCQDWDSAGAGQNSSDGNFLNWAMSVIRQLLFPGKKPKEIIETGGDDDIDTDPDAGKKKVGNI